MFADAASAGDAPEHLNLSVSAVLTVHQSYVDACVHVPLHCAYDSLAKLAGKRKYYFGTWRPSIATVSADGQYAIALL
jgi:hypothetical protein